jgi:phytol kinase
MIVCFIALIFVFIFALTEILYRTTSIAPEWTRKLQHISVGLLASCFPWIFSSPREVLFLGLIMAALLLPSKKLLTSMHSVQRHSLGELYFTLSTVILAFLTHGLSPLFYFIPMLTLTCSDSLAALIGSTYQRATYSIQGHVKSLEGSTVFFVSTFLTVHLPLLFLSTVNHLQSVVIAVVIAFVTTLTEALSRKGIDNLLIPLMTFLLLVHLI